MSLDVFLSAFVAYVVIMDPLGASLIFNALTEGKSASRCRSIALRAVGLSSVVVLGFAFFGAALLGRLGITMEAFRIAGGFLLFHTAFSMVVHADRTSTDERYGALNDISVCPLCFPLMAGPGCLTLTILLFSKAAQTAGGLMATTLAIAVNLSVMLVALVSSRRITGVIGKTANAVIKRLLGVLLASLAVQFIADGVMGLIGSQTNGG